MSLLYSIKKSFVVLSILLNVEMRPPVSFAHPGSSTGPSTYRTTGIKWFLGESK